MKSAAKKQGLPKYKKCSGFTSPHYTNVPDEFFDYYVPYLSESELKVSLYIIRRTFGFKKEADTISLNQLENGIITREGRVLDYGTGLSRPSIVKAIKGLEEKGIIVKCNNKSQNGGDTATTYKLHMQDSNEPEERGVKNINPPSKKYLPQGVKIFNPQETVKQKTVLQETVKNSNSKKLEKDEKRGGGFKSINEIIKRPTTIAVKSVSEDLEQTITPLAIQTVIRENATPQKTSQAPYTAYGNEMLIHMTKEISQEFGDTHHEQENIGQVHNIYKALQARKLSDADLVSMMFRARGLTREKEGKFTTSKMAYFFKVLRQEYNIPPT